MDNFDEGGDEKQEINWYGLSNSLFVFSWRILIQDALKAQSSLLP